MSTFADKLVKENTTPMNVEHKCHRCGECRNDYFIHMNNNGSDVYICSYLCSKNLHIEFGYNYWDSVVNKEKFNHLQPIMNKPKPIEKFAIEYNELDHERNEFIQSLIDEDRRILELEKEYEASSSDSDYDYDYQ